MYKHFKKFISILLIFTVISTTFLPSFSASNTIKRPVTHSNEVIKFTVNDKGRFNIRTTKKGNPFRNDDSKKNLLFYDEEKQTSFTTFRINGEDYIFGKNYAYSLSKDARLVGDTYQVKDSVIKKYKIGENIEILQILSIVEDKTDTNYGNVNIKYQVINNTDGSINVGARMLQDIMIGANQGPMIRIGEQFYDKEIEYTGQDVPKYWRSADNEFEPKVVGYGYTSGWGNIKPDKMIIGHYQGLSETAFEYNVDNDLNFTMESEYGKKDTGIAYYWTPKTVSSGESIDFEVYHGLGQIIDKELTYDTNIYAPSQLRLDSNSEYENNGEFEIVVMLENNLEESVELYDVMANLTFENGGEVKDGVNALELNNDVSLKGTKLIKKDGQYAFRWKMKATPSTDFKSLRYKVDLYDKSNLYKEGDDIPQGRQVGDVKRNEIYSVSDAIVLPSKTGAPPKISFESVAPDNIYYSGKNLVTLKGAGINLLTSKSNWELKYSINNKDYQTVNSDKINVVDETNSIEVTFEDEFEPGEMNFKVKILNDLYTDGTESENILEGDTYKIPGNLTITKDKKAMQRDYGMIAIVQDYNNGTPYSIPIAVKDEQEFNKLESKVNKAGGKVLLDIRGDIRAIRDGGKISKYVVYAQQKRAIINGIATYQSAIPLTIQYTPPMQGSSDRSSLIGIMSDNLKNILQNETDILDNQLATGNQNPGLSSDVEFDFPYTDEASEGSSRLNQTMDLIEAGGEANNLEELLESDTGRLAITGLGVLGINAKDGFDFWMDMFVIDFEDGKEYKFWNPNGGGSENSIRIDLQGIGAVLNKSIEGMPVQINGVRLVKDEQTQRDMITFDATIDLTMIPGNIIVDAKDIFFSESGYKGLAVDTSVAPDRNLGIVKNLDLNVGIDTYRGKYEIDGSAKVSVLTAEVEFSLVKERKNNKWYLNDLVLAGGGEPGIQVFPGVFVEKLGGGIRNLQQLINPYYNNPGKIFTVVLILGLDVVKILEGTFEGEINRRAISVSADQATIVKLDILRDLEQKISWDPRGDAKFNIKSKGSVVIIDDTDFLKGTSKIDISDVFFEGSSRVAVQIPSKVPLVGGKSVGNAGFGINTNKIWGSIGINLIMKTVNIGAAYKWRGGPSFNVGRAGPLVSSLDSPEGSLYTDTQVNDDGEEINYTYGTNVEVQSDTIENNAFNKITSLSMIEYNDQGYLAPKVSITNSSKEYEYINKDGNVDNSVLQDKYIYEITDKINQDSLLSFEYTNETEPELIFCKTKEDLEEPIKIEKISNELSSNVENLTTTNYMNLSGFSDSSNQETNEQSFIVISDKKLSNYSLYNESTFDSNSTINTGSEYIYEIVMDTTEDTSLAFAHKDNLDIEVYKDTTTNNEGDLITSQKYTGLNHILSTYKGQNIHTINGFETGLKDAKFYISSNKKLEKQNILDVKTIEVAKSNTEIQSDMVVELVSENSIYDAEVFYITDQNDNIIVEIFEDSIKYTDSEGNTQEIQGDTTNLFGEITRSGQTYHNMLFPFDEGSYKIYSSVSLNDEYSNLYEVDRMPKLEANSVNVDKSYENLDIYWNGSNYRYTENELKETSTTDFSYYLVKDENIETLDSGKLAFESGKFLGVYEPQKTDPDIYSTKIPSDTPTGSYRVLVVMNTEGLNQEYEYSDTFSYVNPDAPKKVQNIDVNTAGNGFLEVSWDNDEEVEEYYIEVFDHNNNKIESFGTGFVKGDVKNTTIGGTYEQFSSDDPEKTVKSGLKVGESYKVGVTPVKAVDDDTSMVGQVAYSDLIYLPEPNPADINISFGNEEKYTRTESISGIDEDGNIDYKDVDVPGVNSKSPIIEISANQSFKGDIKLNKEKLQSMDSFKNSIEIQLNELTEGINYIDIVAENQNGDISNETFMFYVDTRAPELMIDAPETNEVVSTNNNSVVVKGKTEVGANVVVNGKELFVDNDGIFEGSVPLDFTNVKTDLNIKAMDDFDNVVQNNVEVIRNTSPIKDIVVTSNIPKKDVTIQKPIYEMTSQVMRDIEGNQVEVAMAVNDEPLSYNEEIIKENVVKMGEKYQIDVKGLTNANNQVSLDKERIRYEIIKGSTLASIDNQGRLEVKNNGEIVIKVSFEILGSDKESNTDGYSFEKYITMNSEYTDIYTDVKEDNSPDLPNYDNFDSSSRDRVVNEIDKDIEVNVNNNSIDSDLLNVETDSINKKISVRIDETNFENLAIEKNQESVVNVNDNSDSEIFEFSLNGKLVQDMAQNNAKIDLVKNTAGYSLDANQIDIEGVSKRFGNEENINLEDIEVKIEISKPNSEEEKLVQKVKDEYNLDIKTDPIKYSVKSSYKGREIEIDKFKSFVTKRINLPEDVSNEEITTGIVIQNNGEIRHVPTKIVNKNGKRYALIQSFNNSIYSLIDKNVDFVDLENHWAKEKVNEMASRNILEGVGNNRFSPDENVTRAQFAAIVLRALGLKSESENNIFKDISDSDRYSDTINTIYNYDLITGYENEYFKPNKNITRQEAVVILSRTIDLIGLEKSIHDYDIQEINQEFNDSDEISSWALESIIKAYKMELIKGRSEDKLSPESPITRSEASVVIMRLLKKASLIE